MMFKSSPSIPDTRETLSKTERPAMTCHIDDQTIFWGRTNVVWSTS